MGYINFDKNQLINLEYSLSKEMIRSNRAGSFSCTTILGCNTRKYHGLLITPQPRLDGGHHILLSKVDETIIQREAAFNIGVNKFPGAYNPKGHKYVRDFAADIIPVVTYRVGGVVLTKETLFVSKQERVLIKYTLVEAHSPTTLRLRPFLAFRNIHMLSKKNIDLDTRYESVTNGIKVRMYEGYPHLYLQLSKKGGEYVHVPDWYNDFEYLEEMRRGFEYHEDLYTPGFFEVAIKKGESIIFSASTEESAPSSFTQLFNQEINKRTPRNTFENALKNSAEQFFYTTPESSGVVAGYPWYSQIARYTFLSLPGLTKALDDIKLTEKVLQSLISNMEGPVFQETDTSHRCSHGTADTALWFFWTLQQCHTGISSSNIWKNYGEVLTTILKGYSEGKVKGVSLHDNGLLHIDPSYPDLTWMNACSKGIPVTPRYGYVSEVNALWYNALCFALELAQSSRKKQFVSRWQPVAESLKESFSTILWNSQLHYLADFAYEGRQDMSVRPNQVFAASLPYSPLKESRRKHILDLTIKELLTPRGLRSLSPKDIRYKGHYEGNVDQREAALHQGTVWPWLLGHFADAYLNLYGKSGLQYIANIYEGFQSTMKEHGIGSISEIFDGDPPHLAKGSISFAPSVAELLRMHYMLHENNYRT
jgi:predicted glycogen debranching enzyme